MRIVRDKATTPIHFEKLNVGDVFYDLDNDCISMKPQTAEPLTLTMVQSIPFVTLTVVFTLMQNSSSSKRLRRIFTMITT